MRRRQLRRSLRELVWPVWLPLLAVVAMLGVWAHAGVVIVADDARPVATSNANLSPSGNAVSLVAEFEGFPNGGRAYNDPVGNCTKGYGELLTYARCTTAQERAPPWTSGYALTLLRKRLNGTYGDYVRKCVRAPLNQSQFDALVSAVYNVGGGMLCGRNWTVADTGIARALNARNYTAAANEFLRWNRAGGGVLAGLVRRREAERKLFLSKSVIQVLTVKEQEIVDSILGWRARVARNGGDWQATGNRYALRRVTSLKEWACDRVDKIEGLGSQAVQGRKLRVAALEKAAKGCPA